MKELLHRLNESVSKFKRGLKYRVVKNGSFLTSSEFVSIHMVKGDIIVYRGSNRAGEELFRRLEDGVDGGVGVLADKRFKLVSPRDYLEDFAKKPTKLIENKKYEVIKKGACLSTERAESAPGHNVAVSFGTVDLKVGDIIIYVGKKTSHGMGTRNPAEHFSKKGVEGYFTPNKYGVADRSYLEQK